MNPPGPEEGWAPKSTPPQKPLFELFKIETIQAGRLQMKMNWKTGLGPLYLPGAAGKIFPALNPYGAESMKAFLMTVLLFLSAGWVFGQATDTGKDRIYIGLGTGADLPGSNWDPDYYLGGGADVFGGYQLDKNWAGQLDVQEWFFAGGGLSLNNVRVLAEAKYSFEGNGFQPYLLAGPGLVFQSLSIGGESTTNFDAAGGLGIQFDLAPRTHLFLEAKANFILSQSTTFTDYPISAGLWVGL